MKKYTFSLSKVLRVRRVQEERAAAELAAARVAATAAAAKEAGAAHALASRCARGGLQPAVSFLVWAETTMLAGEALSDAKADVAVADEEAEARRQEWSEAAVRVSALEHLDERGREAHGLERKREETKTVDDIIRTKRDRP